VRYGFGLPGDESTPNGEINYHYDRIGNLISQTSNIEHVENGKSITHLGTMSYGGAAGASGRIGRNTAEPGPHALSQLTASTNTSTYAYDADGNIVAKDGATLTFDFKDRLASIEDASMRADYTYDFRHRRIVKSVLPKSGAPEVTFYVSPSFEVRPPELPVKYVWSGPTRIARVSGSLSTNTRVQRFRLAAGWNLVSLAVSVANFTFDVEAGRSDFHRAYARGSRARGFGSLA
jgi:hypothetical protein